MPTPMTPGDPPPYLVAVAWPSSWKNPEKITRRVTTKNRPGWKGSCRAAWVSAPRSGPNIQMLTATRAPTTRRTIGGQKKGWRAVVTDRCTRAGMTCLR